MKQKRANVKMDLGLLVTTERNHDMGAGYFHVNVSVVTLEGGKIRNVSTRYEAINGFDALDGLRFRCQGENDRRERGVYGFDAKYMSQYSTDLREAERMVQTLRKIEKGMQKFTDTRGYVKTFGDYVGRLAELMKAETIIEIKKSGTFYSDGDYRFRTVGDGVNWIDGLVRDWQNEGKKEDAESVS
jgi:hypothetical protein